MPFNEAPLSVPFNQSSSMQTAKDGMPLQRAHSSQLGIISSVAHAMSAPVVQDQLQPAGRALLGNDAAHRLTGPSARVETAEAVYGVFITALKAAAEVRQLAPSICTQYMCFSCSCCCRLLQFSQPPGLMLWHTCCTCACRLEISLVLWVLLSWPRASWVTLSAALQSRCAIIIVIGIAIHQTSAANIIELHVICSITR